MLTKKVSEGIGNVSSYTCKHCKYITGIKSNYTKHCLTARHKKFTNVTNAYEDVSNCIASYSCTNCSKVYKSRMGLWQHSNKCSPDINKNVVVENPPIDASLILKLIQQNENLQNLLAQQASDHLQKQTELMNKLMEREPGNNNTINGNVTTNNNQKFNLNFFLNETCKDAMNIQEFLENIRVTFQDLLLIGDSGFVTGVSDILIKQLRDLDVTKRPIHCTDAKRETIYLKENNAWNKDDKENTKLKNAIEKIEYKNVVALRDWCNENPDAKVNNTSNNILKDKIYMQTLQGDDQTRNRIIKNLTKEVIVEKGSDSEE
jgi:hypothetical protein